MILKSWFYDITVYIYALSLLFYFSDFVGANQRAKRMGTGLLSFVWFMQFLYLALTFYGNPSSEAFSIRETLLLFSWLLVTLSLVINRFFRIELFVFLVNLLGFAVMTLHFLINPSFSTTIKNSMWNDQLLLVHIVLAMISYATFAIGAVFSGMYLFLHRQLKRRNWSSSMRRLPSLERIDCYTYFAVIIGSPLLLISLLLGVIWLWMKGDSHLLFDSKVLSSLLVLGAYAFYAILRFSLQVPGDKLAKWNLLAFAVVLLNWLVSNYYSTFHQWIGM